MSVININKANFQEEVLNSEKPVLLDFWAPWCGPCRMVGPLVDEIAGERADIKVGTVRRHEHTHAGGHEKRQNHEQDRGRQAEGSDPGAAVGV